MFYCGCVSAQVIQDSVKIHFRTGYSDLDMSLGKNREVLEDIKDKLQLNADDSIYYRLQKVLVVGGASPEGSIPLNNRLSEKRAGLCSITWPDTELSPTPFVISISWDATGKVFIVWLMMT